MADEASFSIRAIANTEGLKEGMAQSVEEVKAAAKNMQVSFQEMTNQARATDAGIRRAMASVSESTKQYAAGLSEQQRAEAEILSARVKAQSELRNAAKVLKGSTDENTEAANLYFAANQKVKDIEAQLTDVQRARAAAIDSVKQKLEEQRAAAEANARITGFVSGAGTVDQAATDVAAATLANNAAKAEQKAIEDDLAASTADAATRQDALALAQEKVRATSAALAEAQAVLKERADAANLAMEEQRRTAEANSVVQERLNNAQASPAAQRIAVAARANAAAQKELTEVQKAVAASSLSEAEKIAALAPALERARLATIELAEANEELGTASHHVVTGQQAASGAIRSLEGNAGLRAVENFISKTLGLGPALQAIFPIVGALAFGQILFDLGEKVYDLEQKSRHAGEAINEAFAELHDKAAVSNDELAIQNDKLQDEIDKLSGHPGNGLQTALDEARKMADQLLESLQADRKALQDLLKEHDVSAFGSLLTGVANEAQTAGTGQQAKEILADQKSLTEAVREAKHQFEQTVAGTTDTDVIKAAAEKRNQAIHAAFQSQIDSYARESARLRKEQQDSENRAAIADLAGPQGAGLKGQVIDNSAKIANIEGRRQQLQDALTHEDFTESIANREQTVGKLKQEHGSRGADKASEDRLRSMEAELNQEKIVFGITLKAEFDFWQQRLSQFTEKSEQYNQILAKMATLAVEGSRKASEEIKKFNADQSKNTRELAELKNQSDKATEELNRTLRRQGEDVFRTGERWDGYNKAVEEGAAIEERLKITLDENRIRFQEAIGGLTPLAAAQLLAADHTREHAQALKLLEDELARLKAEARDLKPGDAGYEQNISRRQTVTNQITQEKGNGKIQGAQDQQAIDQAVAQPYLKAFDHINQGWLRVQNDLIAGNKNIARDFVQMGVSLVQTLAQSFEQMLVKQLQFEIQTAIAHRVGNQMKVADDASSAAQSSSIHTTSALKEIFIDAKTAAAGAFKAVAGIPIVGPVLAPVAAGAAFAGVMALAAFEQGGIVGGSPGMAVPILAHAGERVLTPQQTTRFERMVNEDGASSKGSGNNLNLTYSPNINAFDRHGFRSTLEAHRDDLVSIVREAWNNGGFASA